jgi:hypothetical protein
MGEPCEPDALFMSAVEEMLMVESYVTAGLQRVTPFAAHSGAGMSLSET